MSIWHWMDDQTISEAYGPRNPREHRLPWHATRIMEQPMRDENGNFSKAETYPFPTGPTLKTRCWCDYTEIEVDADLVRACETGSCGRPGCDSRMLTKRTGRRIRARSWA